MLVIYIYKLTRNWRAT